MLVLLLDSHWCSLPWLQLTAGRALTVSPGVDLLSPHLINLVAKTGSGPEHCIHAQAVIVSFQPTCADQGLESFSMVPGIMQRWPKPVSCQSVASSSGADAPASGYLAGGMPATTCTEGRV